MRILPEIWAMMVCPFSSSTRKRALESASKMVPSENVHRSDGAIGELVVTYPDRVVLGSGYTGVQTALMRVPGVQAALSQGKPLGQ